VIRDSECYSLNPTELGSKNDGQVRDQVRIMRLKREDYLRVNWNQPVYARSANAFQGIDLEK
jgi:hypothetical protein